jgi:hypothetical protein
MLKANNGGISVGVMKEYIVAMMLMSAHIFMQEH